MGHIYLSHRIPQIIDLLAAIDKSRYFVQPRPIIVNYAQIKDYSYFISYAFEMKMNSPLWKRAIAWERSRAASGYGTIWGDADRNKKEFSTECHSVDWF